MFDRFVGIRHKDGSKQSVEAFDTESTFLCIAPANINTKWTIVFIRTGATLGAFDKITDAKNVVKLLMQYGLDRADKVVKGKEWKKYPNISPDMKQFILNISERNKIDVK